jgi:hypothetical protein
MVSVAIAFSDSSSTANFLFSAWLVPVVTLGYFIVIILDNVLVWHTNETIARQTSNNMSNRIEGYT